MFHAAGGREAALTELRLRAGRWFDPALVETFEAVADDAFWTMLASPEVTSAVLALDTDLIAAARGLAARRGQAGRQQQRDGPVARRCRCQKRWR